MKISNFDRSHLVLARHAIYHCIFLTRLSVGIPSAYHSKPTQQPCLWKIACHCHWHWLCVLDHFASLISKKIIKYKCYSEADIDKRRTIMFVWCSQKHNVINSLFGLYHPGNFISIVPFDGGSPKNSQSQWIFINNGLFVYFSSTFKSRPLWLRRIFWIFSDIINFFLIFRT